ncbi:SesB-related regulatory protein [Lasiodiplodia theobromae]|uniref:SesB-related regulatory protein n=1 Tax=Lasiodiplodia theobromae TaxID=45133 RepID=UPI0015C35B15|nr:SesB-related regulatory protein [Lasiodiplodia theobromae]KAF4546030.1 SesB-related regulatory protein [Lasiodiplodia theobromae]
MADGFGEPLFNPFRAKVDDFFPGPNHTGKSIDDHSAKLLRGLEGIAQTGDRPIILVARDLGGLVCANALSKQDADPAVVNNIRGLAFFETPFEGKTAARWAKAAQDLFAFDGSNMPSNLKERTWKLIGVNNEFLEFLKPRNEHLQIQCFYKMYASSPLLSEDELVEIASENWDEISSQLAQWIKEFGTPPAKPEDAPVPPGSAVVGDTNYYKEISGNSGVVAGGIANTSRDGIRVTGSSTTNNYRGKGHRPRNDSSLLKTGPERRR